MLLRAKRFHELTAGEVYECLKAATEISLPLLTRVCFASLRLACKLAYILRFLTALRKRLFNRSEVETSSRLKIKELLKSRAEIFTMEQNIHYLDMDDIDYDSLHCFFTENGRVCAYLRAFYAEKDTVKIGRVLTLRHGEGMGTALLSQSIGAIREKMPCAVLRVDAQKTAAGFYARLGFKAVSGEFLEAGIVHIAMELAVS